MPELRCRSRSGPGSVAERRRQMHLLQTLVEHPPRSGLAGRIHINFNKVSAMSDGVVAMPMPASRKAVILASAVPLPPEMIAPA